MIDTLNSKAAHYTQGSFSIGTGKDVILIEGSCRVLPYVNYFDYLNTDNRWTIHLVNLVNFHFTAKDERVDPVKVLERFEKGSKLLEVIQATKWYFHEHAENFGMLNSDRTQPKNIYQFGMKPEADVDIPNWNDFWMLFQEVFMFDQAKHSRAKREMAEHGHLSGEFQEEVKQLGLQNFGRFLEVCRKTNLSEMADLVEKTWRKKRYWWSGSHISNEFTMAVMRLMNEKFLHLDIPQAFWDRASKEDLYANTPIPITHYDIEAYGLEWPQPVRPLIV